MRNSSLVEWPCAENVPGLSLIPKLRMYSKEYVVGERCMQEEVSLRRDMDSMEVRMPV